MGKSEITIVSSAVGCLSAMGLINELKKEDVKIIGIDCNPLSAGLYLCDKGYVVPRGDNPGFINEIMRICELEKPDAILSGPEEELLALSKNKKLLEKMGVLVLCPDYEIVKICSDKLNTYELFRTYNIPTPEIYDDEVNFPCIIKPRFGRGGRGVYKVDNVSELEFFLKKVRDPIVQEFVEGIEFTIDTFADLGGNPLSIIPRIRLQVESGISVKGITVYDTKIIDYCKKIVKKLKLIGPACIQCIKDHDGEIKFTEINPRFGGGSILSIKADTTIVQNLIRIIKGEKPIPSKGFKEGLIMLRYYSEVFTMKDSITGGNIVGADDYESCGI